MAVAPEPVEVELVAVEPALLAAVLAREQVEVELEELVAQVVVEGPQLQLRPLAAVAWPCALESTFRSQVLHTQ